MYEKEEKKLKAQQKKLRIQKIKVEKPREQSRLRAAMNTPSREEEVQATDRAAAGREETPLRQQLLLEGRTQHGAAQAAAASGSPRPFKWMFRRRKKEKRSSSAHHKQTYRGRREGWREGGGGGSLVVLKVLMGGLGAGTPGLPWQQPGASRFAPTTATCVLSITAHSNQLRHRIAQARGGGGSREISVQVCGGAHSRLQKLNTFFC